MPRTRSAATVASALLASERGVPDAENASAHGVAVGTIRRWRREYQRRGRVRTQAAPCPRCADGRVDGPAYAELLGWYLGDGWITSGRRGVHDLHVVDDARYPNDLARVADLMRRVKPGARPHRRSVPGAVVVTSSWVHWPCLFPQHGPGRKHERPIVLEPWQEDLVAASPAAFVRGLLHSDGSRVRNWARKTVAGQPKRYDYPRWQFSNRSADIRRLCCWALDLLEVPYRHSGRYHVSVSTREGVARLDELVGPKS